MNIFEKLQRCRTDLQRTEMKKSGLNKFAGYSYFELADFLPKINELFGDIGLCGIVKYGKEMATLDIVNTEKPEETIQFTSPMSTAALKGCHEVQNLGAVETYIRRYLYTTALEITESDALDKTTGQQDKIPKNPRLSNPDKPPQETHPAKPSSAQDSGEAATEQQKKAIHAIAKGKGIERIPLFGIISEQLTRKVESTDALTKREASHIIETLNEMTDLKG